MIFERYSNRLQLTNLIYIQFYVAIKLIINGSAIRPTCLLFKYVLNIHGSSDSAKIGANRTIGIYVDRSIGIIYLLHMECNNLNFY